MVSGPLTAAGSPWAATWLCQSPQAGDLLLLPFLPQGSCQRSEGPAGATWDGDRCTSACTAAWLQWSPGREGRPKSQVPRTLPSEHLWLWAPIQLPNIFLFPKKKDEVLWAGGVPLALSSHELALQRVREESSCPHPTSRPPLLVAVSAGAGQDG